MSTVTTIRSLSIKLFTGLTAGALANAAQMLFFAGKGVALTADLFFSHWLVVTVVHILFAIFIGNCCGNRLWTAAALLYPVITSLSLGMALGLGMPGVFGLLGVLAVLVLLWSWKGTAMGSPMVGAAVGAALGASISIHRSSIVLNLDTGFPVVPLLIAIVSILLVVMAGRISRMLVEPSFAGLLGILTLASGVSAAALVATGTPGIRLGDAAVAQGSDTKPPIILIILDTLRADHLQLYGYERNTMPNLERFASEHGVVIKNSLANGAQSLTSHASIFTGLYPTRHGAHLPIIDDPVPPGYGYPLDSGVPTLAGLLADAGYLTVGISANFGPLSPVFGLDRGFHHYSAVPSSRFNLRQMSPWIMSNLPIRPLERVLEWLDKLPPFSVSDVFTGPPYRRAERITQAAIEVLEQADSVPLFLFLNYFDPHYPYLPPEPYVNHFPGRDRELGLRGLVRSRAHEIMSGQRGIEEGEYAHLAALYDGELAYLDVQLGKLLDALKKHPDWNEMLVVITSDHGEALGEHGTLEHSVSLYDELTRVPLIVKHADRASSVLSEENKVQSVDLFPGILACAGVGIPEDLDGRTWGQGRDYAFSWLYVYQAVLKYSRERFFRELRSVDDGRYKLLESSTGSAELYERSADPGELYNIADTATEISVELSGQLRRTGDTQRRLQHLPDTMDPEARRRLEALGYID